MADDAVPGLARALQSARAELRGSAPTAREVNPAELFGTYIDRQELAEAMAGTANRKSTAYRTAMRRIQRWEEGRAPGPRLRELLDRIIRQLLDNRRVVVDFEGTLLVSRDERFRTIHGVMLATRAFLFPAPFPPAFLGAYGLPGAVIVDVDYIGAEWMP